MTPPEQLLMPKLSPTMESGKLTRWAAAVGDAVAEGDVVAEIETDKAVMEVESVVEGVMGPQVVVEGAEGVAVGTLLGVILLDGESAEGLDLGAPKKAASKKAAPKEEETKEEETKEEETKKATTKQEATKEEKKAEKPSGAETKASPLARRLAKEKGVDLALLSGTGPGGRVVRRDVEKARQAPLKGRAGATEGVEEFPDAREFYEQGSYEEKANDAMRTAVARRLSYSKRTAPHYYLTMDCAVDALTALRKQYNEAKGVKCTINDFVVKAAALALQEAPGVNVSWAGNAILRHKGSDVGVAASLGEGGLVTPIVTGAELKSVEGIGEEIRGLVERARAKKLKPSEYEGGSFSVSNLGMYGIRAFTAVINPPQAAILAVGAAIRKPTVDAAGNLAVEGTMRVTLSCDHRAIDGATGAEFLQSFRDLTEAPLRLVL